MNKSLSINKKQGVGRRRKRSLARQIGSFLSRKGLVKPANRVCLHQQRKKRTSGTEFLLRMLFSALFMVGSAYDMKVSPIPRTLLEKFGVKRFCPKTTFYREICSLNLESLQAFTDKLVHKILGVKERITITLDAHPIRVWSKNYDKAAWGASSNGTFFGYKLFAAILHGKDIVIEHLLAPANYNELDFARWQVLQILQKLHRIDVLLIDRGYFSFEFFAFLVQKGVGFITVAKQNTAAIQSYLRDIASCGFHELNENTCYHEALLWFPELRKSLRVIFVRRLVGGVIKEYELITSLSHSYSAIQVIQLYSKRQGREDVFDRLKNELGLHKPCKIVDFAGVQAFVALTITAYNVYTAFSNTLVGAYVTVQVMYRWFLLGEIDRIVQARQLDTVIEEAVSKTERYKQDAQHSLFGRQKHCHSPLQGHFFVQKPKPRLLEKTKNRLKNTYQPKEYRIRIKAYSLMGK